MKQVTELEKQLQPELPRKKKVFSVYLSTLIVAMLSTGIMLGANLTRMDDYTHFGKLDYYRPVPHLGWPLAYQIQIRGLPEKGYENLEYDDFEISNLIVDVIVSMTTIILITSVAEKRARRNKDKEGKYNKARHGLFIAVLISCLILFAIFNCWPEELRWKGEYGWPSKCVINRGRQPLTVLWRQASSNAALAIFLSYATGKLVIWLFDSYNARRAAKITPPTSP